MCSLNDGDVANVLKNVSGTDVCRLQSFRLDRRGDKTMGYLGSHLSLFVRYTDPEGNDCETTFFVKTHSNFGKEEDFLTTTGIFQREIDFYSILVRDIGAVVGKPTWCPMHCFSKSRILVLEDLTEEKYMLANGGISLDEAHVSVALQALARMHASSLLLERHNGKRLISEYPTLFREILYDDSKSNSPTGRWVTWQIQDFLVGIDLLQEYSPTQKKLIKDKFTQEILKIYTLNKRCDKYKSVLTHGDAWKNNLMFRYSASGSPDDCKLVDFQFFRYAPPAHDVMHLIHYATRKSLRDDCENRLLDLYYVNLRREFETRGENLSTTLTRSEFLETCRKYKELALIQSLLSMHYILGPVTLNVENQDLHAYEEYLTKHRNEYMRQFFRDESYTDKIVETMCELIDGYILTEK